MDQNIIDRTARTEWFRKDRFGMFIHWGLYSIPARGEWVRSTERISVEDYEPFFKEFNPVDYDPKEWARIAKNAGMKYAVLTTKHHDGFCLFDSKLTDYKSTNTPCGRDLVREYVDAFREAGLKIGFYYSLLDWHHPDYPHYGDRNHPMRENPAYSNENRDFSRYVEYLHGQVRELLTNYGKIDIIWFDFSYEEMRGEKWHAAELVRMARELQPGIIIDNRLEGSGEQSGTILTAHPSDYAGDFACPEQMIPPEGVTNELGDSVPWEACITLNDNWGYSAADHHYKSSRMIIRNLVECVSKNGNLLLNVGPDSKGRFPEESVRILEDVARWMRDNHESVYGCRQADYPKPEWGRYTQNGKKLYAHIYEETMGAVCLKGLAGKIDHMRLLKDGSEVFQLNHWNVREYPEDAFLSFRKGQILTFPLPDEKDTVVEITLK
ncbi:MAG: alpha-L-fucosidase [Firmicutes bacterium]|nr:alpha-L-fucosidase [Bacillota bacterium]